MLAPALLNWATNQARHKFGLGLRALPHHKNPLAFFRLLPNLPLDPPPHNRAMCEWNRL
jgi:hypothetical protein